KGISLPSLPFLSSSTRSGGSAGVGRAAAPSASSFGTSSGPTINVYTTGDSIDAELAVTRALRRVARLNGGVVPAFGWTGAQADAGAHRARRRVCRRAALGRAPRGRPVATLDMGRRRLELAGLAQRRIIRHRIPGEVGRELGG